MFIHTQQWRDSTVIVPDFASRDFYSHWSVFHLSLGLEHCRYINEQERHISRKWTPNDYSDFGRGWGRQSDEKTDMGT